ncbi:MAG: hypothetical protein ACI89X_002354 [Planctomycetota bacterium]|jgi:hypothetical protein
MVDPHPDNDPEPKKTTRPASADGLILGVAIGNATGVGVGVGFALGSGSAKHGHDAPGK